MCLLAKNPPITPTAPEHCETLLPDIHERAQTLHLQNLSAEGVWQQWGHTAGTDPQGLVFSLNVKSLTSHPKVPFAFDTISTKSWGVMVSLNIALKKKRKTSGIISITLTAELYQSCPLKLLQKRSWFLSQQKLYYWIEFTLRGRMDLGRPKLYLHCMCAFTKDMTPALAVERDRQRQPQKTLLRLQSQQSF